MKRPLPTCAIVIFIFTRFFISVSAQNCSPPFVFNTQVEVNAFAGGCTIITGGLTFASGDINDLSPLSGITTIQGNLTITDNDLLEDLDGLGSLITVTGNILINGNDGLKNIDALSGLATVNGALSVFGNSMLMDLEGLRNITSVNNNLTINNNDALTEINGLRNITQVGGDVLISENDNLSQCCAVFDLLLGQNVTGSITVQNNDEGCQSVEQIRLGGECTEPTNVPTMGQWALIWFGLIIMNLGIIGLFKFNVITRP